jgi:ribose 5-phosphate isomerase RpiB
MNQTELEQIVAEVVRRLTAAAPGGEQPHRRAEGQASGRAGEHAGVLAIEDRVVTLNSVDNRLDGLRRLIVQRKAIVTPALRDELNNRGIELDRGGSGGTMRRETTVSIIRCHQTNAPVVPGVEDVTATSLEALVRLASERVTDPTKRVLVLISQTALALCALNRQKVVRAALANNIDAGRAASRAIAANVLVVDPAHLGRVQIMGLVRAFEGEEVRVIPEGLK